MNKDDFRISEPFIQAALAGRHQQFERRVAKPDGSEGWLWAHYLPDSRPRDKRTGFFVVAYDITERKRTEHELRAAMEETSWLNRLMEGRESQIVALKQEINRLGAEDRQEIAYPAVEHDEPAAFFSSVNVVVDLGAAINVFLGQCILDAFCDTIW